MTSVTRPRARSALVSGVAVLLLAGAVGCDSGDDIGDSPDAGVPRAIGIGRPGGGHGDHHRARRGRATRPARPRSSPA